MKKMPSSEREAAKKYKQCIRSRGGSCFTSHPPKKKTSPCADEKVTLE